VVAEVALAMVMLTGAGMLIRSLVNVHNADLGFSPMNTMTMRVSPGSTAYNDDRIIAFYSALLERVRAMPGVQHAAAARWLPVVDAGGLWDIRVEGKEYPPGQTAAAVPQEVTPDFFGAMGMRVLAGRDFTADDRVGTAPVAIVSKAMAEKFWPGEVPLGKRFRMGAKDSVWMSVVGVVNDFRARGFDDVPEPTMYVPHAQSGQNSYVVPPNLVLVVRDHRQPGRRREWHSRRRARTGWQSAGVARPHDERHRGDEQRQSPVQHVVDRRLRSVGAGARGNRHLRSGELCRVGKDVRDRGCASR
jgi:hypothetical protein